MFLIVSYGEHSFLKIGRQLPDDAVNDQAKAEAFACETAKQLGRSTTLYISRRLGTYRTM